MNILTNKTKIVATIGPACTDENVLKKMLLAGVNVCRINFSHGTHDDHKAVVKMIHKLNDELKIHTAILADLQGPKLRVGEVEEGTVLEEGKQLKITTKKLKGNAQELYLNYSEFPKDVSVGETILIDDGKLLLEIVETDKNENVVAKVIQGGKLSSRKGVNLPNTKISLPSLTKKDRKDLDFAIQLGVSWIGLSFVRSAKDIIQLKKIIKDNGSKAKVVAKIEKPEAVADIDKIIEATDAVMVARGDLGVEVPLETLPLIQKEVIRKCNNNAKPVIVATQMMESMMNSRTPSRAEVNDVANAVTDGADAVMLSGETSVGKYPVEVVKTMYNIVLSAEEDESIYYKETPPTEIEDERFLSDSICYNACRLAERVNAKAIVTMSFSGYTGFKLSGFRPKGGVFVFTANYKILNMLSLIWGVRGVYYDKFVSTDHTISDIKFILLKEGYVKKGDRVINIASMPIAEKGMSNMLKLSEV